jgi:hypothetical protein
MCTPLTMVNLEHVQASPRLISSWCLLNLILKEGKLKLFQFDGYHV